MNACGSVMMFFFTDDGGWKRERECANTYWAPPLACFHERSTISRKLKRVFDDAAAAAAELGIGGGGIRSGGRIRLLARVTICSHNVYSAYTVYAQLGHDDANVKRTTTQ